MKVITRMMTNICSDHLQESKYFYTRLFDFKIDFDSEAFVHLVSSDNRLEIGLISRSNVLVPKDYQQPRGSYVTFSVSDADEIYQTAQQENFHVLTRPENTNYGQRRFFLKDPDGTLVDVSSPIFS